MTRSAFGVEDNRISKADKERNQAIARGVAGGTAFGVAGGALYQITRRHDRPREMAQSVGDFGRKSLRALKENKPAAIYAAGGAAYGGIDAAIAHHRKNRINKTASAGQKRRQVTAAAAIGGLVGAIYGAEAGDDLTRGFHAPGVSTGRRLRLLATNPVLMGAGAGSLATGGLVAYSHRKKKNRQ